LDGYFIMINPTIFDIPDKRIYNLPQNARGGTSAFNQSVPIPIDSKEVTFEKLLIAYTAYTLPIKSAEYKEIEIFEVPDVGKGKVYQLNNGHKVIILPKKGTTTINTFVKTGQSDSFVDKEGLAHLLEHMTYNGENKIQENAFSKLLDSLGVKKKAETSNFYTNYEMKYSFNDMENIEKLIKTQAELLQNQDFTQQKFDIEKNVILAEYGENKSDDLNTKHRQIIINNLFNLDYQNSFKFKTETEQTIKNISREDLIDFYEKYYSNNNMITAIVGDIDSDQAIKIFSKYFNKLNNDIRNNIQKIKIDFNNPIQKTKRIDVKAKNTNNVHIKIGFVGPKNNNEKENLLAIALKNYINDYDNLRCKNVLKYTNESSDNSTCIEMQQVEFSKKTDESSAIEFSSNIKDGTEENELKAMYQFIHSLNQTPISDKELEAVKAHLKNTYSIVKEDSSLLAYFLGSDVSENKNMSLIKINKFIENLTAKDLQDFAKKYIDLNKAMIVVVHPDKPISENKSVKTVSFKGNSHKINMADIKEYEYPNNLRLIVDTSPDIKRTTFNLDFQSVGIPQAKPGTAFILSMMLNRDSSKYNKEQYDEIVKTNGLDIDSDGHANANSIFSTVECTPDKTLIAINLIKDKLLYPDFSQERFEKIKKVAKEYYEVVNKGSGIKHKEFYGDNYPFNISTNKEQENVDNITLQDVINLYNQIMASAQGKAVLTVPQKTFNTMQDSIFASLGTEIPILQKNRYINWAEQLNIKPLNKTKILTSQNNNNQANIEQTFKIKESGNVNDNVAIELIKLILGKNLFADIRERQGLAYSATSGCEIDGQIILFKLKTTIPTSALIR